MAEWDRVRWVWNNATERFHKHLPTTNKALSDELTLLRKQSDWLGEGSVVCQQQSLRDFAQARKRFFDGLVPGKRRAGKPKFKVKKKTHPSLAYTRRGFTLRDGRLLLAKGIVLRAVWSRDLPSEPSSVRVYRESDGKWYASFVVRREEVVTPRDRDGHIGFDFGILTTAAATDPEYDLKFRSFIAEHERKSRNYQRRAARYRKEKDEKRLRKAKRDHAREQKKLRRRRQERLRAYAQKVARNHDKVAIEDLKPNFMSKTRLAKKMYDASIAALKRELELACKKYGTELILVPPAYTTMDCSYCGARAKSRIPLSERTYRCSQCGVACDRDRNAARNVALRAGLYPDSMKATVEGHCSSVPSRQF